MKYIKLIIFFYLLAILSLPIANFLNIDVQLFYRIPLINIRLFDLSIIILLIVTFSSNFLINFKSKTGASKLLNILILLFSIFLIFNFIRTFGDIEITAQLAFLGAYLTLYITYYINNFLSKSEIINIIKNSYKPIILVLIFYNFSLLFLFFTGKTLIYDDTMGQRVIFNAEGVKEVISPFNALKFGFIYTLLGMVIFKNEKAKKFFGLIFIISYVIVSLLSFHRGTIFGIIFCLAIYAIYTLKTSFKHSFIILFLAFLIILSTSFSYNLFTKAGIDPIQNLLNTIEFALDTENPSWDKGREFSRMLGIQVWMSNFWFGMGFNYMDLVTKVYNVATPHHLVITSLMHNGLIGTILFLGIYSIFYWKSLKLTKKFLNGYIDNKEEQGLVISLLVTSFLWLFLSLTQEVQLERYSSGFQYILFGAIIKLDDYYEMRFKKR